jgi:hypothetical protein
MKRKHGVLSGRQHGAVAVTLAAATVETLGERVRTHKRIGAQRFRHMLRKILAWWASSNRDGPHGPNGPGLVTPFPNIQPFSNIFQQLQTYKYKNKMFLLPKILQTWHGCRLVQSGQIYFLAQLENLSRF